MGKSKITTQNNLAGLSDDEVVAEFERRLLEPGREKLLKAMSVCAFYYGRGLCVDKHCERCKMFFANSTNGDSQGAIIKGVPVLENEAPKILESFAKGYEEKELKQGKIKKIDFGRRKNISDLIPAIKSQVLVNAGYFSIHITNWMNEDTYFYISQGEGVRCVKLPALTGKDIPLANENDVEFLIGSDKMLYWTDKYSMGDVYVFGIYFVSEKL